MAHSISALPMRCISCDANSRYEPAKFVAWDACEGMCSDCTVRTIGDSIAAIKEELATIAKLVTAAALVIDDDTLARVEALTRLAVAS